MRLLFVEDHQVFRAVVIKRFLAAHSVVVASTLAEARALLEGPGGDRFDTVLLDFDLPDGKGLELMQELGERRTGRRVVAVSSRPENNARLVAAGAFAAVDKIRFGLIEQTLDQLDQLNQLE